MFVKLYLLSFLDKLFNILYLTSNIKKHYFSLLKNLSGADTRLSTHIYKRAFRELARLRYHIYYFAYCTLLTAMLGQKHTILLYDCSSTQILCDRVYFKWFEFFRDCTRKLLWIIIALMKMYLLRIIKRDQVIASQLIVVFVSFPGAHWGSWNEVRGSKVNPLRVQIWPPLPIQTGTIATIRVVIVGLCLRGREGCGITLGPSTRVLGSSVSSAIVRSPGGVG